MTAHSEAKSMPLRQEGNFLQALLHGTESGKNSTSAVLKGAIDGEMPVNRGTIDNLGKLGANAEGIVAGTMYRASRQREGELDSHIAQQASGPAATADNAAKITLAASAPGAAKGREARAAQYAGVIQPPSPIRG